MKAILIGNGFTSKLIKDYSNINMREKLLKYFNEDYLLIDRLFHKFRVPDFSIREVYKYDGALRCSNDLCVSEQLYLQTDRILYNPNMKKHVIKTLEEYGFQDSNEIFNLYFVQYGLIFEVIEKEICSIENLLKVINMFRKIGKIEEEKETKIKQIANKIYYNDGKYGLKDTNLCDYSKVKSFFNNFNFIFTTNYDLILDDICENQDKVFHLHGGFNIEHRNLKSTKRLSFENAYIVWGINGDEKIHELSSGFNWSDFRWDAFRWDQSLLADYFSKLEKAEYDEIHIFGFSGENDQHINKRIVDNKAIKTIYFYCNPENIENYNYQCKIKEIFQGAKSEIRLDPWTKVWNCIL